MKYIQSFYVFSHYNQKYFQNVHLTLSVIYYITGTQVRCESRWVRRSHSYRMRTAEAVAAAAAAWVRTTAGAGAATRPVNRVRKRRRTSLERRGTADCARSDCRLTLLPPVSISGRLCVSLHSVYSTRRHAVRLMSQNRHKKSGLKRQF